jgi:hypothetical protein
MDRAGVRTFRHIRIQEGLGDDVSQKKKLTLFVYPISVVFEASLSTRRLQEAVFPGICRRQVFLRPYVRDVRVIPVGGLCPNEVRCIRCTP